LVLIWILVTLFVVSEFYFSTKQDETFERMVNVMVIVPNDDAQNVHQPPVRRVIWEKFYYLRDLAQKDLTHLGVNWYGALQENSMREAYEYANTCPRTEKNKLIILLNKISELHDAVSTRNLNHTEREVFALVWWRFQNKKLDINTLKSQLLDCFEEGHNLYCIVGRISRYLSSLTRVDKDSQLSEPELSQNVLFAEALAKSKSLFDDILKKHPALSEIYTKEKLSETEIEDLNEFIKTARAEIKKDIVREFPELERDKIQEILTAIS